jgi:hypothetical protein
MAKAAEWSSRVRAWRASGRSAREFCEDAGFSTKNLLAWSSRLGRAPQDDRAKARVVRLARVIRKPEVSRSHGRIVVHVSQARVEVDATTDRSTLTMILGALLDVHGNGGAL